MPTQLLRLCARAALCSLAFTAVSAAVAQNAYPNKPIRLIVPFAAGGTTDIIARVVAEPLRRELGHPIVVDNKAGAGGTIGSQEAVRAKPDGYTLSMATVSTTATNPAITPKFPYNPETDFTPIINIAATPNIIAVTPKFPGHDYKSFVQELKKNPGKYSYASTGTGSITHMLMEMYKASTAVQITHIPYRGAGPALSDVVAGQVSMNLDNLPSSLPFIKAGKLVPIVVATPKRLAALPDVPTFKEVGLESVNRMAYYGIVAPKGTSKEVVDTINAAVKRVLANPTVQKSIEGTGSVILGNTPEQFSEQIKTEFALYKQVVKTQNLTLE